jgi:hypothetical protein
MKKVNDLLVNKLKVEVILLRDINKKKNEEILKLKYILDGIKDLLNIDESNIKINLKTRPEKPKYTKNEIVLYIHPTYNIKKVKVLKVYTEEPNYYFYDVILEEGNIKQTIEDYLMKY